MATRLQSRAKQLPTKSRHLSPRNTAITENPQRSAHPKQQAAIAFWQCLNTCKAKTTTTTPGPSGPAALHVAELSSNDSRATTDSRSYTDRTTDNRLTKLNLTVLQNQNNPAGSLRTIGSWIASVPNLCDSGSDINDSNDDPIESQTAKVIEAYESECERAHSSEDLSASSTLADEALSGRQVGGQVGAKAVSLWRAYASGRRDLVYIETDDEEDED